MYEIVQGLFLGDEDDARNRASFQKNSIHAVINCAIRVPNCFQDDGIDYLHLMLEESSEITKPMVDRVIAFVQAHEARGSILVHCSGGNQRSPSIMLVILLTRGHAFFEALEHILKAGQVTIPPTFTMLGSIAALDLNGEGVTKDDLRTFFYETYRLRF